MTCLWQTHKPWDIKFTPYLKNPQHPDWWIPSTCHHRVQNCQISWTVCVESRNMTWHLNAAISCQSLLATCCTSQSTITTWRSRVFSSYQCLGIGPSELGVYFGRNRASFPVHLLVTIWYQGLENRRSGQQGSICTTSKHTMFPKQISFQQIKFDCKKRKWPSSTFS
jgi:hypothetical protein